MEEKTTKPAQQDPASGAQASGRPKGDPVKVTRGDSPRERQGRWPTSSYLPGFTSKVASRSCPKCGFQAFAWAETCRCGASLTD